MKPEAFDIKVGGLTFFIFRSLSSCFSFSSSFSLMKLKNDSKSIFKGEISFEDTYQEIDN